MSERDVRLVVFDWDGTLIDSIGTIVSCTQATLVELGLPAADDASIRASIGLGIRDMVDSFLPSCDDDLFHRITEVYRRLWLEEGFGSRSEPFAGVNATLDRLSGEGRLLAVATAKGRKGLAADFERTALDHYFHTSRTVDEASSKPSPDMLLGILDELGVSPDEALMVGDAIHDLQMAHNAGVAAVGVTSGATAREDLMDQRPVECLDSVAALPDWLVRYAGGARRAELGEARG